VPRREGPVLVVEDDPDLRALEAELLSSAGYRVTTAADGLEALDRVEEERPALVLLDMRMPRMDGWKFAAAFRERYGDACPIVVVTAAAIDNATNRSWVWEYSFGNIGPPGHGLRRDVGMWVCSGNQIDSKRRASASRASISGRIA